MLLIHTPSIGIVQDQETKDSTLIHIISYQPQTTMLQKLLRVLLGAFLLYTGTGHLTFAREEFVAQVPLWLPLETDLVVVLSGIAELLLGALLVYPWKFEALVGWLVAIFFVLIFPGNISQYVNRVDAFGLDTDRARFIRLFFQPLLIAWALWATGGWEAWKQRSQSDASRN